MSSNSMAKGSSQRPTRRILEDVCVGPGPDRGGIVAGWVRHSDTDEPIRDASVRLTTTKFAT